MNETRIAEIRPSEESLKKAHEIMRSHVAITGHTAAFDIISASIALALDEAKAERTEECRRIAKTAWLAPDMPWPDLADADAMEAICNYTSERIASLTQKDTPHNAE